MTFYVSKSYVPSETFFLCNMRRRVMLVPDTGCDSPAEQSRGTPSKLSPTLAACAATTLAAWMCSVRETASGDRLPLPDAAGSLLAACNTSYILQAEVWSQL